ncbi:unnamed protein product [Nezara viridula]|uniref:Uncharacterized protein n=1 Tax=Nezara viridula TaxID=85310 RepID=A0A9P0HR29_NEZVI|nr:unnamed protein product [Nezara viridula]
MRTKNNLFLAGNPTLYMFLLVRKEKSVSKNKILLDNRGGVICPEVVGEIEKGRLHKPQYPAPLIVGLAQAS